VHLGFGEDQAAADAVLLCVSLAEQLLSSGVVFRPVHLPPPVCGCPVLVSYRMRSSGELAEGQV
jgi:hypothetical protein